MNDLGYPSRTHGTDGDLTAVAHIGRPAPHAFASARPETCLGRQSSGVDSELLTAAGSSRRRGVAVIAATYSEATETLAAAFEAAVLVDATHVLMVGVAQLSPLMSAGLWGGMFAEEAWRAAAVDAERRAAWMADRLRYLLPVETLAHCPSSASLGRALRAAGCVVAIVSAGRFGLSYRLWCWAFRGLEVLAVRPPGVHAEKVSDRDLAMAIRRRQSDRAHLTG